MINNFFRRKKYMVLSIIFSILIIFGAFPNNVLNAESSRQETYKQLNLFGDVFQRVQEQYVEEVTDIVGLNELLLLENVVGLNEFDVSDMVGCIELEDDVGLGVVGVGANEV